MTPVFETIADRRLRRQLGGDDRSGRYARRRYREAYRSYLRQHWRWMAFGAVILLAGTAALAALVRGPLLRGVVIGFGAAASIGALSHWVIVSSGAAPLMMGELAEQWTASELRPLVRKGWRLINHLSLPRYGDIDHVVLGTSGVFVVETRWSGLDWTSPYAADRVERKVRQAKRAAGEFASSQLYKSLGLPAPRHIVVLWGAGAEALARSLSRSDVLAGSEVAARMQAFGMVGTRLTVAQLSAAWASLSEAAVLDGKREEELSPIPASVQELALMLISGLVVGMLAFVAGAELLALSIPVFARVALVIAAGALLNPLRRWFKARAAATGWQVGMVAALVLFVVVTGGHIARWS